MSVSGGSARPPGRRRVVEASPGRVSPGAAYLTVRELLGTPHLGLELFSGSQGLEHPIRCSSVRKLAFGADGLPRFGERDGLMAVGPAALARLDRLAGANRRRLLRALTATPVAGLVLSRSRPIPEGIVALSREASLPLLVMRESLETSLSRLVFFLRNRLDAEITVHGVLVEIFGVGVLILGPSGIGKSESALELVTRGHRLIADDMVIVHRGENRSLMGSGSGLARYHMEIRGIGIIDIKELYGVAAVLASAEIELVVQLEEWNNGAHYDRLGIDEHYRKMLEIPVPELRVPVSPGRNIAVILEVAARNHLLKKQGYHSARELNRRLLRQIVGGRT
ncbi:MAG: HPr(Ser) kinase/phosphatase [Candidatus Methylomirabilia bacterium]